VGWVWVGCLPISVPGQPPDFCEENWRHYPNKHAILDIGSLLFFKFKKCVKGRRAWFFKPNYGSLLGSVLIPNLPLSFRFQFGL